MSDGIASLYISCTEIELFLRVENIFLQNGIRLTHPIDECVKMLDDNYDIGNYSRDDLLEKLSQSDQVSFQWWWGEGEDLYCRIRKADRLAIIEFGIEHTTKEQAEKILLTLIDALLHQNAIYARFVFDRSGYLNINNYDIGELVIHNDTEIHNLSCILSIVLKNELNRSKEIQMVAEHIMYSIIFGFIDKNSLKISIFG